MKRRVVLKYAASAVLGAPLLSTVLFGSTSVPNAALGVYKPVFFSPEQLSLLKAISDTILPKTDSPSASEVGVPEKIDHMLPVLLLKDDRADYLTRFQGLADYISKQSGDSSFNELSENDRFHILSSISASSDSDLEGLRWALWDLKGKTVNYYRNTQAIATEFLNYLPVPGYYDPCISLEESGGKAWAI